MKKLLTITTDFGDQFATSQLKAVAANLDFDGQIIENHSITPFSIVEGAFELSILTRFTQHNSVYLGIVDPGVGSSRWGIIIKTKHFWFVGPNNGLLYPAAQNDGIKALWKINESAFDKVSTTFHGRDIFIKTAVLLAQGRPPENFGSIKIDKKDLEIRNFQNGQIVHIDYYGNYKIHWTRKLIPTKQKLLVSRQNKTIHFPVVRTFSDLQPGKPLALLGSSNTLELAVNLSSAQKAFNFKLGEILKISETTI